MNRQTELNDKLEQIYHKFDSITNQPPNDFVDDYITYTNLLYNNYEKIAQSFWKYFKEKYELPELESYFKTSEELLRVVFEKCIHPFYIRLDYLPNYNQKYYDMSRWFEFKWKIKRVSSNNWIILVTFCLMILLIFFSSLVEDKNSFIYSLLTNISIGLMISIIISLINSTHKRWLNKKKKELTKILYQYDNLKKAYNKINYIIINEEIKEKSKFVTEFCMMNNALKDFIKNTENIKSIKSIDIYHRLLDFEKEIFDFSSEIYRRDFVKYVMDQTSDEEISNLQRYVIRLGYWIDQLDLGISKIEYGYSLDIKKMKNKTL